ncbi:MAG: GNAT family N-acetyltransferase [Candidatus Cloacimonetes bacterium]|nr:GNAT family N-acetyltransferase [Candidatus Cloacimonadota bacterium]
MQIEILEANESLNQVWLELRQGLWPQSKKSELLEEMAKILRGEIATESDPDYGAVVLLKEEVFLGFLNNEPLGLLELSVRNDAPGSDGLPIAFVEGWYIVPKFRGMGYGKELMKFALTWAKDQGFRRLASDTTSNFPGSYEAHLALGFSEVKRVHHLCIDI